jgi:hypothetical protein
MMCLEIFHFCSSRNSGSQKLLRQRVLKFYLIQSSINFNEAFSPSCARIFFINVSSPLILYSILFVIMFDIFDTFLQAAETPVKA